MKKLYLFGWIVLSTIKSQGQFFLTGQDPGNLHWYQIRTPHFQIIYPEDFRPQAQRIANTFESSYSPVKKTLNSNVPVTPVIMHSHSAISNGITSWAPRRIELFPIPYQGIYAQHWYEQLALHEFRHICQFNSLNIGFTRTCTNLFGESATAVAASFVPEYFYEGDAVLTETALSLAGRGRLPSFQMQTRAYMLERNGFYKYRKVMHGSYRNKIPDHYQFGYLYVASIRDKYGYKVWENTMKREGRLPGFFAYNNGLHSNTGKFSGQLYRESFLHLDTLWRQQDDAIKKTSFKLLKPRSNHTYTNYSFPHLYKDSTIIAVKSGIDDLTQLVKVYPGGAEKTLVYMGTYTADNLSVSGPLAAWNEYLPDVRWEHRTYSVIRTFNLETGATNWLTEETKYFYPVVSPDANKIAVIEYKNDQSYSITLISSSSGEALTGFKTPGNLLPMGPCWDDNGKILYMILNSDSGKKIVSLNIETGIWQTLFAPRFWEMFQLNSNGEWVYFRSAYSGIENIYALNKNTRRTYQVTSSRFGAFDPHVKNDQLYYSDYSSDGYNLVSAHLDTSSWNPVEEIKPDMVDLNMYATMEEGEIIDSLAISSVTYKEEKYSKLSHLVKIHTWTPFYYDWTKLSPHPYPVIPGLTVASQNDLGTAAGYAGVAYGLLRKQPFYFAGFTYLGFFPVFNIEGSYGGDQEIVKDPAYNAMIDTFPSRNFLIRSYLPLNFSRGAFFQSLVPEIGVRYTNAKVVRSYDNHITGYGMGYVRMQYAGYLKKSYRDLTPRLGLGMEGVVFNAVINPEYFGSYYTGSGIVYLPGILKHQSIAVTGNTERVQKEGFAIAGSMRPARGYDLDSATLKKTHSYSSIYKISVDYYTPLFYPDLSLYIIYIKRVWGVGFYDFSTGNYYDKETSSFTRMTHHSYGAEIYMDFHFLHFFFPLTVGYRYAVLPDLGNKLTSQILFSTTLTNF